MTAEYRCDKCGYFLTQPDKPADVRVKIICNNCRKHHLVDLSKPPQPRERVPILAA